MPGVATPKRVDPKPRPVEGPISDFDLINQDPDKFYVCVSLTDTRRGAAYYEAIGYEIVKHEPNGPRFKYGKNGRAGDPVTHLDTVLVCCSKERKAEIDRVGPFGGSGQEEVLRVEKLMTNKRAGRSVLGDIANMRTRDGDPLIEAINTTEPARGSHTL